MPATPLLPKNPRLRGQPIKLRSEARKNAGYDLSATSSSLMLITSVGAASVSYTCDDKGARLMPAQRSPPQGRRKGTAIPRTLLSQARYTYVGQLRRKGWAGTPLCG